jgi:hypothetical protein
MTTNSNLTNVAPYLQTSRKFPMDDDPKLETELAKMNIDVATAVNLRSIGIYDKTVTVTGNQYFSSSTTNAQLKRFSQRVVFSFSDASLTFAHGLTNVTIMSVITGGFTDGTNFYPLPYVDVTNVNNQVAVRVTPTNVVITKGAGAPPTITSGIVILEFLQT